ncbi:MAG: translational GTPase TypA [Candidatus Marinimicrobia bacterium]|nr:translational GTPase TypA [Candidatus Neomarinimicrobiota bacterium]
MGIDPTQVIKLSGIGCSSKSPAYFLNSSHGFNTVHGRMPSVATGALLANRNLIALGVTGDGDTASIGIGQFVHLMRRNIPMLYVIEDNGCYGLTKGQFSATADVGSIQKTGVANDLPPIDTCALAIQLGATFVARSFSGDKKHLQSVLKAGLAHNEIGDASTDLTPLFDTILAKIPGPVASDDHVPQLLVTNLDHDRFMGQIAIGRLNNGVLQLNRTYSLCGAGGATRSIKFSALYTFAGLQKVQVEELEAGDIIAVAGVDNIVIGDTISSEDDPQPLPRIEVDAPTVSMLFNVNNSPTAGKEGKYLTSRQLGDRLQAEVLTNVSLKVNLTERTDVFEVCGRGELQMAILIETMRREGYEFTVSKPHVITREENGKVMEPMEHLFLDIPEEHIGVITEKISQRKGRMTNMQNHGHGRVNMEFSIPSRGLIGFRSQFMTDTKGAGIMNKLFDGYAPWFGPIPQRVSGALVADRAGKVTTYACLGMVDRGELFVEVGTEVYAGMIIGSRNRTDDLAVNITREKKLTNMRAATSDFTVTLRTPRLLTLDQSLEFIAEDELVEVTPGSIRLRKMELDAGKRLSAYRKAKRG